MNDQTTRVSELREMMRAFVAEREWEKFHDPKNLACSILIEAGELMEHFQWLRSEELDQVRADTVRLAAIGEELADVLAFVLSFANSLDIDLSSTFAAKMKRNGAKYPADEFRGRFSRPVADADS